MQGWHSSASRLNKANAANLQMASMSFKYASNVLQICFRCYSKVSPNNCRCAANALKIQSASNNIQIYCNKLHDNLQNCKPDHLQFNSFRPSSCIKYLQLYYTCFSKCYKYASNMFQMLQGSNYGQTTANVLQMLQQKHDNLLNIQGWPSTASFKIELSKCCKAWNGFK